MLLHFGKPQPPHDLKKPPIAREKPFPGKRKMPFSRTNSAKDGTLAPPQTTSARKGNIQAPPTRSAKNGTETPPRLDSSRQGSLVPSRTNSSKNDELEDARPTLQKRHTLKGAFNKISTTFRRVRTFGEDLSSIKSTSPITSPKLARHRPSPQISVSEPCTLSGMRAALSRQHDGTSDFLEYECKRSNAWYNNRRRLEGECNHVHGTCDWRTVPVFSDGDSVDMSSRALDVEKYWQTTPMRKRNSTTAASIMEERAGPPRSESTSLAVSAKRKNMAVEWKHPVPEP